MSLQGSSELIANLKLIKNWTDKTLKTAMDKSLNLIEISAKAGHIRAKSLSKEDRASHPSDRYYTHTGDLTGSIHSEGAKASLTGISGIVSASEAYAEKVENGSPNSRAYPFMAPALNDNGEKIVNLFAVAVKEVIK